MPAAPVKIGEGRVGAQKQVCAAPVIAVSQACVAHVGAAGKIGVPLINTVVQGSFAPVHVVTQAGVGTVHGLAEIDVPAVVAEARVNPSHCMWNPKKSASV